MTSIANDIPAPLHAHGRDVFAFFRRMFIRHGFILPSVLISLGICFWFTTWGDGRLFDAERFSGYYDAQARAMLHGRLDVPPEAIGFEAFVRDGKSYGYFGIAPAILRLPLVILFPRMDGRWSRCFMLLACAINLLCAYRLVLKLRGDERRETPAGRFVLSLFILCAGIGSTNVFILSRSYTYHEAIMWGATFALLFTDFLLGYLTTPTLGRLAAMGLFAFLAFHCRATAGAGALLAMCTVTVVLVYRTLRQRLFSSSEDSESAPSSLAPVLRGEGWGEGQSVELRNSPNRPSPYPSPLSTGARGPNFPHALLALLAVLLTITTYFAINYAKFHTFDGVPVRLYGLYIKDPLRMAVTGGKQFHPENLVTTLAAYFGAAGLQFGPDFPWAYMTSGLRVIGSPAIDVVEPHSSMAISMPAIFFLCLLGIRPVVAAKTIMMRHVRLPIISLFLGGSIVLFTVGITERYLHDFYPFLIVLGAAGVSYVLGQTNVARRVPAILLLTLLSVVLNCAFALEFQREIVWGVAREKRQQLVHVRQAVDRFFHRTPIAAAGE